MKNYLTLWSVLWLALTAATLVIISTAGFHLYYQMAYHPQAHPTWRDLTYVGVLAVMLWLLPQAWQSCLRELFPKSQKKEPSLGDPPPSPNGGGQGVADRPGVGRGHFSCGRIDIRPQHYHTKGYYEPQRNTESRRPQRPGGPLPPGPGPG